MSFAMDRKRYYALLIALGALMNAVGGIMLGVFGDPDVFLYFEFIGIVFFYIGFVMSSRFVFRAVPAPNAPAVATPVVRSGN